MGASRLLFFIVTAIALPLGAQAQSATPDPSLDAARLRCAALRQGDFSMIEDAPTQLQSAGAAVLEPTKQEVCRVDGTVRGNVGFAMLMPLSDWNGKYVQGGCGGACGVTIPWWCYDPMRRGYACLSTDMGHRSGLADWQWARDDLDLRADFGYRATHVVSIVGKALAAAYLGKPPSHAYFMGCSTGGRQAHVLAQRFPADFDGIVAGSAPHNETGSGLQLAWTVRANLDAEGKYILREPQAKLLNEAVVRACDMNDGLKDGLIGDPRRCSFDPASLACAPGASGDACLSAAQVEAARKMYRGPTDAKGRPIGTEGGVMRGSELWWIGDYMPRGDVAPQYPAFMTSFFRHAGFDPALPTDWRLEALDFERARERMASSEFIYNAQNPDLREFKRRGGKLLAFQGWGDTSVVPLGTLDYYDTVTRTMGGLAATQSFYRLFVVPGMRHCSADGEGGDAIDYLAALDAWVTQGRAPDALIGHNFDWRGRVTSTPLFPLAPDRIRKTRVHFPYPDEARYRGRGDPNDPASWQRVPGLPQR